MENRIYRKRRLLLTGVIAGLAVIVSGCSYVIRFNLRNLSGQTITVNYTVKDIQNGLTPMLIQRSATENRTETVPIPDDRIRIDIENGSVEFKLFAKEEVELDSTIDGSESDYEKTFNLRNLRIAGEEGSVHLEGREVFKRFQPIKKSWYQFGPETIGFVFEYR